MHLGKPGVYAGSRSSLGKAERTCHLLTRMQTMIRIAVVQGQRGGPGTTAGTQGCADPSRRRVKG